jgi:hypothetical protein
VCLFPASQTGSCKCRHVQDRMYKRLYIHKHNTRHNTHTHTIHTHTHSLTHTRTHTHTHTHNTQVTSDLMCLQRCGMCTRQSYPCSLPCVPHLMEQQWSVTTKTQCALCTFVFYFSTHVFRQNSVLVICFTYNTLPHKAFDSFLHCE